MIAVGDKHDVATSDLGEDVDGPAGRAVHPLEGEPRLLPRAIAHFEVVNLLELGLVPFFLVVFVGRVRGPVAAGRDDLADHQPFRFERAGMQ